MASRALGAFLALAAAALFVVSIAASAFWAGYPVVDGKQITAKHVHVGPLGATGCNVGGDGSCESIALTSTVKLVGYATLGASALAALFAVLVLFAASRVSERRKGIAAASVVFTLLAAGGAGAMLALGPGIAASQHVAVPIGWGAFAFGGGVLASLLASLVTRKLEPEPLRLKSAAKAARAAKTRGEPRTSQAQNAGQRPSQPHLPVQRPSQSRLQPRVPGSAEPQTRPTPQSFVQSPSQSRAQSHVPPMWEPPPPAPLPTWQPPEPVPAPAWEPPPPAAPSWQPPASAPPPIGPRARERSPSATHEPVNPFARTHLADEPRPNPTANDPLVRSDLPGMPPVRPKPPSLPPAPSGAMRAKPPSIPPAPKPPSIAPPPKKPIVPVPGSRPKPPPLIASPRSTAGKPAGPTSPAERSSAHRTSTEQGPGSPPPERSAPRGSKPKVAPLPSITAPAERPAKRRSDTEMRTGKNAITDATETGVPPAPASRAETDSDVSEPPAPAGDDTDAEVKAAPNGAPAQQRISEAEMAKLAAQASAPDPTAQTLLAPEIRRRDPQDLLSTVERGPRTPIPTIGRKEPPVIDSADRPVQVPISTAPASLPPPTQLDTEQSGPSPACPQCEAPMGWVDEHLRFYCRACRMYF